MNRPKISIVTVCRNSASTIERTIRSVISQTYADKEYIVIDGNSNDGTVDVIKKYDRYITKWVSEPDGGIYDAMNKGIAMAAGEWIHILNADDRYAGDDALAGMVQHLDPTRTNYGRMFLDYGGGHVKPYEFRYAHWYLYVSAKVPHPAMIVTRRQYTDVGLYDPRWRIASDHDFILRILERYPQKFTDVPLVVMQQDGISAKNMKLTYQEFRDVTIRHHLPRWLAYAIYWIKRWRFNI